MGQPIDGKAPFEGGEPYCVSGSYINPLQRPPIRERMEFGVKAIDGMITIGKGQRIGIFAGSGVGKSTLMGMIAKNVKADINVNCRQLSLWWASGAVRFSNLFRRIWARRGCAALCWLWRLPTSPPCCG